MAKKVSVSINMQGNYLAVIKKAQRYTSAFDKDVKKMTADLDKARKKKIDIAAKDSKARKVLTALEKKIAPMRNVMVKVAAHVQHFKNQIKPVTDTIKKVTSKAWTVTVKIKDGVSSILGKIGKGLKTIGKGVAVGAAAVVGAGAYALNKGMGLEGYGISMEHFVGVNNPNNTKAQNQKLTEKYLNDLRLNANATPFGTEEVIQAGSRAVQIAEGNTDAAMGMVKMAEDMAALTPGKTVMDAMEALADANMGEFERMKEFGFKMSAEEFKKSGYDLFSTKSTSGKTLVQVFGGGAAKFANTTAGMWSTITGELESEIAEIGLELAKGLKPALEWLRDDVLPDIKQWLKPIKEGGQGGMQTLTDGIKCVYYWLKEQIPLAIAAIKTTWDGLVKTLSDPNSGVNKLLKMFGVDLSSIFAAPAPAPAPDGKNKRENRTAQTTYGDPSAGGLPKNSVFYDYAMQAAQEAVGPAVDINKVLDVTKGASATYALFKAVQFLTSPAKSLPGKIVQGAGKVAGAGVDAAAIAAAGASPELNALLVGATQTIGQLWAGGLQNAIGPAYYWWQDQKSLAQFDYFDKTGKSWDHATLGEKSEVWLNRALPGLNGWTPPYMREFFDSWEKVTGTPTGEDIAGSYGGYRGPNSSMPYFPLYPGMQPNQGMLGAGLIYNALNPDTSGLDGAANMIDTVSGAATDATGPLQAFVTWINQVKAAAGGGEEKPHAAGIKRVPSDNYPALLHKGETVLPSGEAGEYRRGGNSGGQSSKVFNVNITVNGAGLDGNGLASLLVGKLQEAAANMA